MRIATCVIVIAASFALLLVAHGSVHLLGAAKAFGWAELPQLTQPVSSVQGSGWLAATTLFRSHNSPNQNVRICQRKCDSSHVPRVSARFT